MTEAQDKIRGSLWGGAIGDALGYPIEFWNEKEIFQKYGSRGITGFKPDSGSGKALISDDTQMTLFTANGILFGETRGCLRGIGAAPHCYVAGAYQDWLKTQRYSYEEFCALRDKHEKEGGGYYCQSWLCNVPELFSRRAPGNTCLSALVSKQTPSIRRPVNGSKGCGGVMRVAPLGLWRRPRNIEKLDYEGAELAALTHGHSLGYMPAAVLTHIISRIVYPANEGASLKEIVQEASQAVARIFAGDSYLQYLLSIIDQAVELSENSRDDLSNIHELGEGWVAEEALAIAIYCSLRHQISFSDGIIAAVNHQGDSDSTGAITGNILGAWLGFAAIDDRWKANLELASVIDEMAADLGRGCPVSEYSSDNDPVWLDKYLYAKY